MGTGIAHCNVDITKFETLIILDFETTGLSSPGITELSMIAIPFKNLKNPLDFRAKNTLVLCFKPEQTIDAYVTKITKLSNQVLDNFAPFDDKTLDLADAFLEAQAKPVLVVAHNGFGFDFPILKNVIQSMPESKRAEVFLGRSSVYLADSLNFFKEYDNLKRSLQEHG